ncbi:MAG: formate--tetrahydrofolate ligase [Thermotogota bacterium]|nr:formate--tetrahydrofolate ligase [Thermotogota bacterium]MDK2864113.1 formate--tetrahydrofolate ligase [Thermotogota bacterium]
MKNPEPKPITTIGEKLGISPDDLIPYGKFIAKVPYRKLLELKDKPDGKLVLVTAMNPTPAGEGKTTTSIGLSMAFNRLGINSIVTLREPSLGPVMGVKGGATGGGNAQILPMEEINLHFTGDIHAVTSAHNLLSAMLDAALKFSSVDIDPTKIIWPRAMDMNDRALRHIVVGLGGSANGVPREDGFVISAASEVMAILCLARDLKDLKERLSRIIVAYSKKKNPITAGDLKAHGAMAVLLKDAMNPNLVQTIENTPVFVHGGPFANIAHGTNSVIATRLALKLSDVVVTEAGFGADLGGEKFLDFVSRVGGFNVNGVVLVASLKALKYHGGVKKDELDIENLEAIEKGFSNLVIHYENMSSFGVPVVVALNRFDTDTSEEIKLFENLCVSNGMEYVVSEVWEKGGAGATELAKWLLQRMPDEVKLNRVYDEDDHITEKLDKIAKRIYRAKEVVYSKEAIAALKTIERLGFERLPVIVAKTQYSLSDDPKLLGAPKDHTITIRDLKISAGAGFIVAVAGDILLMPGLPKESNAMNLDLDEGGNIIGLS